MTLPQKITDAIDAYRDSVFAFASDGVHSEPNPVETRAALERAIAEHTSSLVRQIPTAFMGEVPKDHRFVIAIKDASIGRELSKWSRDVASLRADLGTVYQTLTRQKGHEAGPEFGSSEQAAATPAPSVIDAARAVLFHGLTSRGTLVAGPQLREKLLALKAVVDSRDVRLWERSEVAQFGEPSKAPSALERLRERVAREPGIPTSWCRWLLNRIDEEREREAGHG